MGQEIKTSMRIDKIQKVDTESKNKHKHVYAMVGKDADGIGTIKINFPNELKGFKPDQVIDITIRNSQMSLDEFEGTAENKEKKDIIAEKLKGKAEKQK